MCSHTRKMAILARGIRIALLLFTFSSPIVAQGVPFFDGMRQADNPQEVATVLEILILLTVLTLVPSFLVLMTAFTRIVIVLSFIRRALGTQTLPPNQIVIGLALILTFFVMFPTFTRIKDDALVPYMDEEITQREMFRKSEVHIREFMFIQTRKKDVKLFLELTDFKIDKPPGEVLKSDIGTHILVPAFVLSELRRAFEMGFALFLPFLIIDLVVAAVLISMGMLVLPPILISMPFKILLFVLVDGWYLIVGSLLRSFG